MAEPLVIEAAGLCKRYRGSRGEIDALRGLDLEVPAGSSCGVLGRNGAGKTTTIKVRLGMAHASGGRARVFGLPVGDERASVEIGCCKVCNNSSRRLAAVSAASGRRRRGR